MLKQIFTAVLAVTFLAACDSAQDRVAEMSPLTKAHYSDMVTKLSEVERGDFIIITSYKHADIESSISYLSVRSAARNTANPAKTMITATDLLSSGFYQVSGLVFDFGAMGVCKKADPCWNDVSREFLMK